MKSTINFSKHNTFYNGGWVKTFVDIDDNQKNGYKYQGDFVPKSGLTEIEDGLYIICNIGGSRKNQQKIVHIVKIIENKIEKISDEYTGNDWSLKLLPEAKKILAEKKGIKENPLAKFSDEEILTEIERRKIKV